MPVWADAINAFGLVGLAELGDKSQLLCLALAARYGPRPVLTGAALAFTLLNLLAVTVGVAIAGLVPERAVEVGSGLLFVFFGIRTLWAAGEAEEEAVDAEGARAPWLTTFLLFAGAEMGDKTQLAVAGLAAVADPVATFLGATAALVGVSALGALAGGWLHGRLPQAWIHRAAGAVFVGFGLYRLLGAA